MAQPAPHIVAFANVIALPSLAPVVVAVATPIGGNDNGQRLYPRVSFGNPSPSAPSAPSQPTVRSLSLATNDQQDSINNDLRNTNEHSHGLPPQDLIISVSHQHQHQHHVPGMVNGDEVAPPSGIIIDHSNADEDEHQIEGEHEGQEQQVMKLPFVKQRNILFDWSNSNQISRMTIEVMTTSVFVALNIYAAFYGIIGYAINHVTLPSVTLQ
jgi:hypothetical protein